MSEITPEELLGAADTLSRFADLAVGFHQDHPLASEAAQMQLTIQLVNLYLLEFAKHCIAGKNPTDALLVVLEGSTPVSPNVLAAMKKAKEQRLQ